MLEFNSLVWLWILIGILTFTFLMISGIRAPYGRHVTKSWGPTLDNKWGWVIMEVPALVIFPALSLLGPQPLDPVSYLLIGLWVLHYFYRAVIFPFQLKTQGKKMPVMIVGSALVFNLMNGGLNGYYIGFVGAQTDSLLSIHVLVGLVLFFIGMYINRQTDARLIALRKENKGYQIPQGWLFKYISCPNHFGEIVEWIGFALVAWSLPAASFAVWTFCNLVPRAYNHHQWYKENFPEYPKRNVVFPHIW